MKENDVKDSANVGQPKKIHPFVIEKISKVNDVVKPGTKTRNQCKLDEEKERFKKLEEDQILLSKSKIKKATTKSKKNEAR